VADVTVTPIGIVSLPVGAALPVDVGVAVVPPLLLIE
jgi:hypothetical protein